jgi:hypothetical protein
VTAADVETRSPSGGIDELYGAFVATLPPALAGHAEELAMTLGLAPSRDVPWSSVFGHEVTLGAPRLVADAMPELALAAITGATLAHMLSVIEAFGTDRIEDGQVPATPELGEVLARARAARDDVIARVRGDPSGAEPTYARAEQATVAAIRAEQEVFRAGRAVSFERYLAISRGKQSVGLPAALALARAAGWNARRARCLEEMLYAVWVGLQLHDDVIDWEDDLRRGGAWAASLAASSVPSRPSARELTKTDLHASGVLARMLAGSARCFRAARRRASVLGAHRLAGWAREREETVGALARREAEAAGFANRAHALSSWSKTVLA